MRPDTDTLPRTLPRTLEPNFVCARCKEGFHNLGSLYIHADSCPYPVYEMSKPHILTGEKKRVVYISGPYRAATENGVYENIQVARVVATEWWRKGYAVICPHLNSAFMGGFGGSVEEDQEMLIEGDLELVRRSDIIVMLPTWSTSIGARREKAEANRCNKEVVFV